MNRPYRRKVALELIDWLELDPNGTDLDLNASDCAEELEECYPLAYFAWQHFDAAVNPDESLADLIA